MHPVVHFEICGGDGRALREFYTKTFGWRIDADNPMSYGLVDTGDGRGIGGGVTVRDPDTGNRVTIYVEVNDVDECLARIESAGGKVLIPKVVIPNLVTYALFKDPAGNTVGVIEAEARRRAEAWRAASRAWRAVQSGTPMRPSGRPPPPGAIRETRGSDLPPFSFGPPETRPARKTKKPAKTPRQASHTSRTTRKTARSAR